MSFVKMEEFLINIKSKLVCFVDSFNPENTLVLFFSHLQFLQYLSEVVKVEILVVVEHAAYFFALFFDLISFLLLFPVISKHVFNFLLVALKSALELINPNYSIRNIWEVTHCAQAVVVLLLLEDALIQQLNVRFDLTQEVRLVVLDSTSNLLTLQKLVVEGEDVKFVSRSRSLTQLILNQNCKLSFDFCSALGVSGFGLLPLSSSLN
jgi:hypothetical protein